MKILIYMSVVHKNDILKNMTHDAISLIKSKHDWGLVVDSRNIALATKWNDAIKQGVEYDYVFIISNDILPYENMFDEVVDFMEKNREYVFVTPTQILEGDTLPSGIEDGIDEEKLHWSVVAFRAGDVINKVGMVDSVFERGTFVDTEWEIRARKIGVKMCRMLSPKFGHYNEATLVFMPDRANIFSSNHLKMRAKWGDVSEFRFPYNDESLPLTFIGEYNGK